MHYPLSRGKELRSKGETMVFCVIINHRVCTKALSLAEAKRAATWYANRVRGVTVSVGVL